MAYARVAYSRILVVVSILHLFLCGQSAWSNLDHLVITEVDPISDAVEVTYLDESVFTNSNDLAFCHELICSSVIPMGTVFGSNVSITFAVPGLNDSASDIWLYRGTNDFTNVTNIITGMKFGSSVGIGHTQVAVDAGIWTSIDVFIANPDSGESMQLRGSDSSIGENWISSYPTPDEFIQLTDPIADIPDGEIRVGLLEVAEGMVAPLGFAMPDDNSGRMFIFDEIGLIHVWQNGDLLPTPILDVQTNIIVNVERGLIGLALHPDFASNGKLYTYTSEPKDGGPADFVLPGTNHHGVVSEWQISSTDSNLIDASSKRELMRIPIGGGQHVGGTLEFDSDGNLFVSLGDGGNRDDEGFTHGPTGNGQNINSALGSIFRIDVDGTNSNNGAYGIPEDNPFVDGPGIDEIYAYGFRNPYRFSFDKVTGELYAGDVGQDDVEEVNIVVRGGNYGWRLKEGSFFFNAAGLNQNGFLSSLPNYDPTSVQLVDPIAEYDHDDGSAVIGGYVYRGSKIHELYGRYVFADFGAPLGVLYYIDQDQRVKKLTIGITDRNLGLKVKGLGQDLDGELYVTMGVGYAPIGNQGSIHKLIPLLQISDVSISNSDVHVEVIYDSSLSAEWSIEREEDLMNPSGWSTPSTAISPIGPNVSKATFPLSGGTSEFYRVIENE